MFATYGGFRRRVAVLTVLSLVASVLVAAAAPVSAADDPEPSYGATFDACAGVSESGFADVPAGHANAGDIDCIAYYGITKGTSATTYSPRSAVTREQMALFLMRLAERVEIPVPAAGGTDFTDVGDLSAESQAAISQLAQLGITQGTSATTYSPAGNVTRGQMALFVQRLMNNMEPMADGEIGLGSTTQYGHIPSDVADNDDDAEIGSPYTDLGRATKDEWDAVTELYELGVASGISATSYGPESDISRASMAGFMAAVLDHSNVRPAGLSIQATPSTSWGDGAPTVMISVRDDSFAAVEDQSVDVFSSASANGLRDDGTCNFGTDPDDVRAGDFVDGDCVWNDNDDTTDADGNLILEGEVRQGNTRVYYAWIGEDGAKFDDDTADAVTVSVTAKHVQTKLGVSSDINKRAYNDKGKDNLLEGKGQQVDLRADSSVTFTVQLQDDSKNDVARSGIEVNVEYQQGAEQDGPRNTKSYVNTHEATLVTDENGQVTYTVSGPDKSAREDDLDFTSDGLTPGSGAVHWIAEDPGLTSDSVDHPVYVLDGNPSVMATVRLWDQYGNSIRSNSNQKVEITYQTSVKDAKHSSEVRQVISRGYARWSDNVKVQENQTVTITYDVRELARNSDGQPIHKDDKSSWEAAIENKAGDSAATVQDKIDALRVTYNDGKVTVAKHQDGKLGDPVYLDKDDKVTKTGTVLITRAQDGAAIGQNIINTDALDIYADRDQRGEDAKPNVRGPSAKLDEQDHEDTGEVVWVVEKANSTDAGDDVLNVVKVIKDDDKFLTDEGDKDDNPELVYSYDSDDIFIDSTDDEGIEIDIAKFESLIDNDGTVDDRKWVQVLAYDVDGTSIFRVKEKKES